MLDTFVHVLEYLEKTASLLLVAFCHLLQGIQQGKQLVPDLSQEVVRRPALGLQTEVHDRPFRFLSGKIVLVDSVVECVEVDEGIIEVFPRQDVPNDRHHVAQHLALESVSGDVHQKDVGQLGGSSLVDPIIRRKVPLRSVDQVAGTLQLNSVVFGRVLKIVVVLAPAQETFVALFAGLVVVVHVGPAAGAARNGAGRLLSVLQVRVDGVDEAAERGSVAVVEGQGGWDVAVGELEGRRVVLHVLGVLLKLLLLLRTVGRLLLVSRVRLREGVRLSRRYVLAGTGRSLMGFVPAVGFSPLF